MSAPTVVLTQDQIDFYHREGYLSLEAITTQEEVDRLREIYDRLFERRAGRETGDQFDLAGTDEEGKEASLPQILNPSRYAPELLEGQFRINAEAIAKQLLGEEAALHGEHAINKPPRQGAATPWHQDEAYWDPAFDYAELSIWIPLQPATLENGCMQFIPGSHKQEVAEHQPIGNDPRVHGLELVEVDARKAVACILPAGGCTIHGSRTMHYAGPNTSDAPRRALILTGGLPATPRAEERRFPWNERKHTAREERARAAQNK